MADPMNGANSRCPWCSASLPDPAVERCPSCGAALVARPDAPTDIKGVTTLDPEAILRARSDSSRPQRGNRLFSLITGEVAVDTSTPAGPDVFAPPPEEVRREMLRLQFEAERADMIAERVALKADELARRGIHLSELGDAPAPEAAAPAPSAPGSAAPAPPAPEWPAELTLDEQEDAPRG